jgi:beta-galactosidase
MSRRIVDLDLGWRFKRGEVTDSANTNSHSSSYLSCKAGNENGAVGKKFDDSSWRVVDLPHDYFSESEFSSENLHSHGYRERCNAYYRKTFTLDGSYEGKEMFICFEGTAPTAFFYLNGSLMERTFSAYNETVFNATDRLYCDGRPNVLSVYIDGLATEGWWYEGAGIYRHVRLYAKDKLHIAHNGIFAKPVLKKGTVIPGRR